MEKSLIIVILVAYCGIVKVHSLQCYICNDCGSSVSEEYLQTCGAPETTTITPTTTTAENITTIPPNNSTDAPHNSTYPLNNSITQDTTTTTTLATPIYNTNTTGGKQKLPDHLNDGCICENGECDCHKDNLSSPSKFIGLRAILFTCYKVTYRGNKTNVTDRGCIPIPDIGNVCEYYSNSTNCSTCNTDKCNSADLPHTSLFLLTTLFYLSYA